MNVISRSAITISYKKPFAEWNNKLCPDMPMEENLLGESKTYLVKEYFGDANKVIKKYYK
jgi:hypothetical protein